MEHSTPIFHVPAAIEALLARHDLTQGKLAAALDMSPANLVKVMRREDPQRLSVQSLNAIRRLEFLTPAEVGGFMIAHLRDELIRAEEDLRRYVLRHVEGVDLSSLDLTAETNANIGIIARAAEKDSDLAALISSLADRIALVEATKADMKAEVIQFPGLQAEHAVAEEQSPYDSKPKTGTGRTKPPETA